MGEPNILSRVPIRQYSGKIPHRQIARRKMPKIMRQFTTLEQVINKAFADKTSVLGKDRAYFYGKLRELNIADMKVYLRKGENLSTTQMLPEIILLREDVRTLLSLSPGFRTSTDYPTIPSVYIELDAAAIQENAGIRVEKSFVNQLSGLLRSLDSWKTAIEYLTERKEEDYLSTFIESMKTRAKQYFWDSFLEGPKRTGAFTFLSDEAKEFLREVYGWQIYGQMLP